MIVEHIFRPFYAPLAISNDRTFGNISCNHWNVGHEQRRRSRQPSERTCFKNRCCCRWSQGTKNRPHTRSLAQKTFSGYKMCRHVRVTWFQDRFHLGLVWAKLRDLWLCNKCRDSKIHTVAVLLSSWLAVKASSCRHVRVGPVKHWFPCG